MVSSPAVLPDTSGVLSDELSLLPPHNEFKVRVDPYVVDDDGNTFRGMVFEEKMPRFMLVTVDD